MTANGGRLYSSGSGPVVFTNKGHISFSGTGNRYFELGGISEYSNILSPVIRDGNGGVTSVRKTGEQSTWILTGENTYSGGTTVNDGTYKSGTGNTGRITGDIEKQSSSGFQSFRAVHSIGTSQGQENFCIRGILIFDRFCFSK